MIRRKDFKGFTVIEILLALIFIALLTLIGLYVVHNHNSSSSAKNSSSITANTTKPTSTSKTADPYAGWKTYTLQYEKFSFKYPSSYTINDQSSADSSMVTPGTDWLTLTKSDGFVIQIQTGLHDIGGACPDCKVALSKQITLFNKTAYLNFREEGDGNIGNVIVAANDSDMMGASIQGKNIKSTADQTVLPIGIILNYQTNGVLVEKPLQTISNSTDIAEAVSILASASY